MQKKYKYILSLIIILILANLIYQPNFISNRSIFNVIILFYFSLALFFINNYIAKDNIKFVIISIFATVIITIISLYPVFQIGWPLNHELLSWKNRMLIYVVHLKHFDFFPIWSTQDLMEFGSPMPLYYHKLFYYFSSTFFILIGSVKTSILLTIIFLFCTGCFGIYLCLKRFGIEKHSALIFSWVFIFLSYNFTNWFIRGAMAEFSAAMVVPYLFLWIIKFFQTQKFNISITFILFIIYLAHNAIAYYSVIILLISFVFYILLYYRTINFKFIKNTILALFIFLLLISIFIIPMFLISKYYNPAKIIDYNFIPQNQFRNILTYFWDKNYSWKTSVYELTVQFDSFIIFLILILLFFVIIIKQKNFKIYLSAKNSPLNILGILLLLFLIFLQLPISSFFYTYFPLAEFIQFPWRLNVFIQILFLFILAKLTVFLLKSRLEKKFILVVIFILVISVLRYPGFRVDINQTTNFLKNEVESVDNNLQVYGIAEYTPIIDTPQDSIYDFFYNSYVKNEFGNNDIIRYQNNSYLLPEQMMIDFVVNLTKDSVIIFPYNFSGLETLKKIESNELIRLTRTPKNPKIHAHLPAGNYEIRLKFARLLPISDYFYEQNINNEIFSYKDDVIYFCNFDTLNNDFALIKIYNDTCYIGGTIQDSLYYSHKNSLQINCFKPFGMTIFFPQLIDNSVYNIEINKLSSKEEYLGNICISSDYNKIYLSEHRAVGLKNGWGKMQLKYYVPLNKIIKNCKIYLWNENCNSVYFDDFKLKIQKFSSIK